MYLSWVIGFAALAASAVIASRRDRLFLIVAALAALDVTEGLARGVEETGPPSLTLGALALLSLLSAAEALGLPGPLARRSRLGIHNRERDYDLWVWRLVGPFAATLGDRRTVQPGPRRDRMVREARDLRERLAAREPPTPEWGVVRDGYVRAVELVQGALSRRDPEPPSLWGAVPPEVAERLAALRARYRPVAPGGPRWAVVVLAVALPIGAIYAFDVADRAVERVIAPSVADGWTAMPVPFARGDSWGGNAVSDGQRVYLLSRENVQGFWGTIRVRSSNDGGLTWSSAGAASLDATSSAARPTMALGPDGSVWVAFARQGAAVATQMLQIGRSTDHGATWPMLARASPPSIGMIGLPALLVTADVRLVAYTDGATGAAILQRLGPQGEPLGPPSVLGFTTRELYSDAQFLDAGFALAADGRHVVALWHPSDERLDVAVSDDAGASWRPLAPLSRHAVWPRPHLLVSGGRFLALVDLSDRSGTWLELDSSDDGGANWTEGPRVSSGPVSQEGVLAESHGAWTLAYAACSGVFDCTLDPRIWYRTSADGRTWTSPQALSTPGSFSIIGAGIAAGRPWAIWEHDLSQSDEDRDVEGAVR